MTLVFDTETTGKAEFKLPATHASQPDLVQIGALLFDDEWKVRGEINLIVQPNGWIIPKEVSDIHGITQDIADKCGVQRHIAVKAFIALASQATTFVAHNIQFDELIMNVAVFREELVQEFGLASSRMKDSKFCTMHAMTSICKIPGRYDDFKWPRLQEAFKHAFGKEFEGAHDAMADVRACADIYRWLMKPKVENLAVAQALIEKHPTAEFRDNE